MIEQIASVIAMADEAKCEGDPEHFQKFGTGGPQAVGPTAENDG